MHEKKAPPTAALSSTGRLKLHHPKPPSLQDEQIPFLRFSSQGFLHMLFHYPTLLFGNLTYSNVLNNIASECVHLERKGEPLQSLQKQNHVILTQLPKAT